MHQIVIDGARFDAVNQVDDHQTFGDGRVLRNNNDNIFRFQLLFFFSPPSQLYYLEISDRGSFLALGQLVVNPVDNLFLDDRTARIGQLG